MYRVATRPRRPVGVSLLGALGVLAGAAGVVGGAYLIWKCGDTEVMTRLNRSTKDLLSLGIGSVLVGSVLVIMSRGLLRGSRGMQGAFGVLAAVGLAGALYGFITFNDQERLRSLIGVAAAMVVLCLLFATNRARDFFD